MAAAPSASASASPACAANLYNIPVQDAACAVPFGGNATDIMSQCCGSAPVIRYYEDCGLYCLAADQSVEDLTTCMMDAGAQPQDVFCRGNVTATATGSTNDLPTSAQATIVAGPTGGGGGGSSGDSGDGIDGVDSGSDESSGSDSNDASTTSMKANMGYAALTFAAIVTLAVPFWVG